MAKDLSQGLGLQDLGKGGNLKPSMKYTSYDPIDSKHSEASDGIQTKVGKLSKLGGELKNSGGTWETLGGESRYTGSASEPKDGITKKDGDKCGDLGQDDAIKNSGSQQEIGSKSVAPMKSESAWDPNYIADLLAEDVPDIQHLFAEYASHADLVALEDFNELIRTTCGDYEITEQGLLQLMDADDNHAFHESEDGSGKFWLVGPISEEMGGMDMGMPSLNPFKTASAAATGGSHHRIQANPDIRRDGRRGDSLAGDVDQFGDGFDLDGGMGGGEGGAGGDLSNMGSDLGLDDGMDVGMDDMPGGPGPGPSMGDDLGPGGMDDMGMDGMGDDMGMDAGGLGAAGDALGAAAAGESLGGAVGGPVGAGVGGAVGAGVGRGMRRRPGRPAMGESRRRLRESHEDGMTGGDDDDSVGTSLPADKTSDGMDEVGSTPKLPDAIDSKHQEADDGIQDEMGGLGSELGQNSKIKNKLTGGASSMEENINSMATRARRSIEESAKAFGRIGDFKLRFRVESTGLGQARTSLNLSEALLDMEEISTALGNGAAQMYVLFMDNRNRIAHKAIVNVGKVQSRGPIVSENRVIFRSPRVAHVFAEQVARTGAKCQVGAHHWGAKVTGRFNWNVANAAYRNIPRS